MEKGEMSAHRLERTWRFRAVTPFLGHSIPGAGPLRGHSHRSIGSKVGFQWTVSRGCSEVLEHRINETEGGSWNGGFHLNWGIF